MTLKPTYEELEQKVKLLEEQLAKGKQVEESLHDTEKLYHLLFDHSPDGVVIVDPATARFLDFNETTCLMLGYTREEFSKLSIFDLEANQTPEEIRLHIEYVIKHGISDFETRQRTKQGKIINLHVTAQSTEVLGKPVYHCIWRDITDRKQAEHDLLREMNQLQTILNLYHRADTRIQDIEAGIIEECVRISESRLGFFGLINEDETVMMAHLWSEQAM
ncbi:MAG: PAS domain S-box protein, partial [Smithella sp.]